MFQYFTRRWDKWQAFLWLFLKHRALTLIMSRVSWRENMWHHSNRIFRIFLLETKFQDLCFKFCNLILGLNIIKSRKSTGQNTAIWLLCNRVESNFHKDFVEDKYMNRFIRMLSLITVSLPFWKCYGSDSISLFTSSAVKE